MSKVRHMKDILSAAARCKPFSDAEALAARDQCKAAADQLVYMGETFALAFREANRLYLKFKDVCEARGLADEAKAA